MWAALPRSVKSSGLRAVWSAVALGKVYSYQFSHNFIRHRNNCVDREAEAPCQTVLLSTARDVSHIQFHSHTKLLHFAPCCRELQSESTSRW